MLDTFVSLRDYTLFKASWSLWESARDFRCRFELAALAENVPGNGAVKSAKEASPAFLGQAAIEHAAALPQKAFSGYDCR